MVIFAFFNGVFEMIFKKNSKKSSHFRFNNLIVYFVRETNWLCCEKKPNPTWVYPTSKYFVTPIYIQAIYAM